MEEARGRASAQRSRLQGNVRGSKAPLGLWKGGDGSRGVVSEGPVLGGAISGGVEHIAVDERLESVELG